MNRKLGAHLSIAGGHSKALEALHEKGGNCLQIFSCSPRTWADAHLNDEEIKQWNTVKEQWDINPVYFHACYLINLADPGETGNKSVKSLIQELNLAPTLGVKGSIVHTGSFKNKDKTMSVRDETYYPTLLENIKTVLKNTPQETFLILENAGNRKIGQTIDQLAEIITDVQDERIKVCIDTCHLHAAGYDLTTHASFEVFLDEFDTKIGLEKLEVVHLNDSKDRSGSLRDRHENLGKGNVGVSVFKNLLNNKRTKHLPFIIETPGFDDKGPDKKNLDILKSYIQI